MRKLKLSLKKEIISDLESKEVKGGMNTIDLCKTEPQSYWTNCEVNTCVNCLLTKNCETTPLDSCECLPTYMC
jgi:hypothetical protein